MLKPSLLACLSNYVKLKNNCVKLPTTIEVIQQQRIAVENDITVNEKLLAEAQKRLEGREAVFYKRVRDIYINGRLSYLDVVIGSKDFKDFANRLEI